MIGVAAALALAIEVIAVQPVPRGAIVTAADLEGSTEDINALVGLEAARPLFKGRAVRSTDLTLPTAVTRQSAVTVLFVRGPLVLKTEGRAMGSGRTGESVDVLLPGRRQPIMATVVAPGTVEVN